MDFEQKFKPTRKKKTNKQNQLHALLLNKSHFQTNFTSPPFKVS